jgi:DNA-binding transcriptional ArsR family regulator
MALSPTLWRTARVLAGKTRLGLLRRIVEEPGQSVSDLAEALGLSRSRASQELRRLQSRGIVQASRDGVWLRYRPVPDPLVSSAQPILAAMEEVVARYPEAEDERTVRVAKAFSHARRLAIIQELRQGARSAAELQQRPGMPEMAVYRHLPLLEEGGVVCRVGQTWRLEAGEHPLAQCLMNLLK